MPLSQAMNSALSSLLPSVTDRPAKLYRYSQEKWLERALRSGEFILYPIVPEASLKSQKPVMSFTADRASVPVKYLSLSLSDTWDRELFQVFGGANCCLVIHDTEQFGERVHRAARKILPSWAGIDAAVSYGVPSPLGSAFSKTKSHSHEKEWLFAWRPTAQQLVSFNPVVIEIGNLEKIAELRKISI